MVYYDDQPETIQVIRCGTEAIVRIRENIAQCETGWQADEYEIRTMWTPNLEARVSENCQAWLEKAKEETEQAAQPDGQSTEEANRQLISSINSDLAAFMDYFFTAFPEQ